LLLPNRVHLSLRPHRFFSLLSTPPRGDAVTSSSHPAHGTEWAGTFTPQDGAAPQRTSGGFPAADTTRHWNQLNRAQPAMPVQALVMRRLENRRSQLAGTPVQLRFSGGLEKFLFPFPILGKVCGQK
jgi:hypothetical protein